jgi:hypothetical protein
LRGWCCWRPLSWSGRPQRAEEIQVASALILNAESNSLEFLKLREVFSAYVRLLTDETRKVVEIYQWFVNLKLRATGEAEAQ